MTGRQGVYLLHAAEPIGNQSNPRAMAQHYIGHGYDLERRIAVQLAGSWHAAALVRAFRAAGVAVFVARTWPGQGRAFERRLKRRKNARKLCPACRPQPWENPPAEDLDDELVLDDAAELAVERALEDRHVEGWVA